MRGGLPAGKAGAELVLIDKTICLQMARSTRFGVVEAQARIVEQHPAQGGPFVGHKIGQVLISGGQKSGVVVHGQRWVGVVGGGV